MTTSPGARWAQILDSNSERLYEKSELTKVWPNVRTHSLEQRWSQEYDASFYKLQCSTYLIFIYLPMHLENWKLAFFNLSFCCVL